MKKQDLGVHLIFQRASIRPLFRASFGVPLALLGMVASAPAKAAEGPTRDEVFAEICRAEIAFPEIVMRQALLETGNLKPGFLMSRNNLFGFRYKKYLTFENWQESVAYYKRWQDKRYRPGEDYYSFLVRIRYAGRDYPKHVKTISWTKSCSDVAS